MSNVLITDATSGATAHVDNGRNLLIYDTIAGYTKNPAYAVNITDGTTGSVGSAVRIIKRGVMLET